MTVLAGASWAGGWDEPGVLGYVLINGELGGLFVYNGTPAAGNLVATITAPAVSEYLDPFGNMVVPGGYVTYQEYATNEWIAVQYTKSGITVWGATSYAGPYAATGISLQFVVGTGIDASAVYGQNPSTGDPDTWIEPSSLANSWINASGFAPFQYRIVASPPNSVELIGVISATSATSATFFTLPSGYQPAHEQGFAVGATGGVPSGAVTNLRCTSAGVLSIDNAASVPAADSYFIHGFISLDA